MLEKERAQSPKGDVGKAGTSVEKKEVRTVLQDQGKKIYQMGISDQSYQTWRSQTK